MCRYSYAYHSACRHTSAVPAEYCEKAGPAVAPASSPALRKYFLFSAFTLLFTKRAAIFRAVVIH